MHVHDMFVARTAFRPGDLELVSQRRGLEYYGILRWPAVQINACFLSRMTIFCGDVFALYQYAFNEPAFLVGSKNPSGVFLLIAPSLGRTLFSAAPLDFGGTSLRP